MYQAYDRDDLLARLKKASHNQVGNPTGYVHPFFSGDLRKVANVGSTLTSTMSPQGRLSNVKGQKGGERANSFLNKNAVGMVSNTPPKPTQVSMESQKAIDNVHKNLRSGQVRGLTPKRGISSAKFNTGQPKVPTAVAGTSNVKMTLSTPRVKASSVAAAGKSFRMLGSRAFGRGAGRGAARRARQEAPPTFLQRARGKVVGAIPVVGGGAGVYGALQQRTNHRGIVTDLKKQMRARRPNDGLRRKHIYHHGIQTPANPQGV